MLDNMKTLGFSWARALNPAFLLRSSYRSSIRRYEATRAGISLGVDAAWTALILVDCKAGRAGKDRAEDMSVPAEKAALCDGSQQRQLQAEARLQGGKAEVAAQESTFCRRNIGMER